MAHELRRDATTQWCDRCMRMWPLEYPFVSEVCDPPSMFERFYFAESAGLCLFVSVGDVCAAPRDDIRHSKWERLAGAAGCCVQSVDCHPFTTRREAWEQPLWRDGL